MKIRKSVGIAIATIFVVSGIATQSLATYDTMTEPTLLTAEEYQQMLNETQLIGNEFGEFERTSEPVDSNVSGIIYDLDHITKDTQFIVLEYGVFKKKK